MGAPIPVLYHQIFLSPAVVAPARLDEAEVEQIRLDEAEAMAPL